MKRFRWCRLLTWSSLGVLLLGSFAGGDRASAYFGASSRTAHAAQGGQKPVEDPREERKEAYLAQAENALAEYSRELVKLAQRAESENSSTRSAFERARRDFVKKAEELQKILAEVSSLSPQSARARKHEVDAALKATERAYTRALSAFR